MTTRAAFIHGIAFALNGLAALGSAAAVLTTGSVLSAVLLALNGFLCSLLWGRVA